MAKEDETPRPNPAEIENLIEQIWRTNLEPGAKEKIERLLRIVLTLVELLQRKNTSIKNLGASSDCRISRHFSCRGDDCIVRAPDESRDHGGQFVRLDRLGNMHLEAGIQGAHAVFNPSIGRERHRRGLSAPPALPFAHSPYQAVAVFTRHSYVDHHHIGPLL